MQSAIRSRHEEICELMLRVRNNGGRDAACRAAASSVNWRTPNAADRFLERLQHVSTRNRRGDTMYGPGHSNVYER